MNATSKSLSIVAYYLSEYSGDALNSLGYRTYTEAFKQLSVVFERENNYLKLRRDEFDALPESNSTRLGWHKRAPVRDVLDTAEYLRHFTFDELTELVRTLISNAKSQYVSDNRDNGDVILSLQQVEAIMNATDSTANIKIKTTDHKIRIYNVAIIHQLKHLYNNRCQICGCCCGEVYDSHVSQAHHIDYFSKSMNNDANNILIVCPNHHAIIHDTNPQFDSTNLTYHYPNGYVEGLKINMHL